MEDRIERQIDLAAPIERVWRAITDHEEFGTWFQVRLDAPFAVGEISRGQITYPGYEHLKWAARVEVMDKNRRFVFKWRPLDDEKDIGNSDDAVTTVEFLLTPSERGTHLVISESGFSSLPDQAAALEAFRRNANGWELQTESVRAHVEP